MDDPTYYDGAEGTDDPTKFLCGNGNLGPTNLPTEAPLGCLLQGYTRFGDLKPAEYLKKWWGTNWLWPHATEQGFLLSVISTSVTLGPGVLLDRFGHPDTRYFAPFGTPYAMRSLPTSSLNDPYTVFQVLEPLDVVAGPIAPGFEQPGLGTQYIAGENPIELERRKVIRQLPEEEVKRLYRKQAL